jgi:gluconate:H+ symporter, GntP family
MEHGIRLLIALIVSIIFIVMATSKYKLHPFLALLIAAYGVGFMAGMPSGEIVTTITSGFGNLMANIGIVIILGTLIGVILEKSGAALKMADLVIKVVGNKHPSLAMGIIGYIVSIPVFCDSGFVILSSLKRSLIFKTGKPAIALSIALATGLYATHTFVPPTPGPLAAAGNLGLEKQLGMVILLGGIVAFFAMLSGYFWANYVGKKYRSGEDDIPETDPLPDQKLPNGFLALLPILLPIVLIALGSILNLLPKYQDTFIFKLIGFLGNPVNALFLGLICSFFLIKGKNKKQLTGWISEGLVAAAPILIITGAGGAFGAILKTTHIGDYLGETLADYNLGIFLPFIIAAALKSAQGSTTVSMVATSALVAPLLANLGFDSEIGRLLVLMAVGAGAMIVSHANDSYFWVVTQFSKMDADTGYKTHTIATLIQGVVSMVVVFLLSLIFV